MKIKSWVSGPKWGGIRSALRQMAFETDVDIVFDVDSGLLTEKVYFTVSGDDDNVRNFSEIFDATLKQYC